MELVVLWQFVGLNACGHGFKTPVEFFLFNSIFVHYLVSFFRVNFGLDYG